MRRRSQKRYRVTYATRNVKGYQNDPKVWCNTDNEGIADKTAQYLSHIPNVSGANVYDRDKRTIVINYGQPIGEE